MKNFTIIFLLLFSTHINAENPIKSLRSIFHENGEMYVSSARDDNHSKNKNKLELLWDSKNTISFRDNYQQDWKEISINEINFNKGADAKNYILFHKKSMSTVSVKGASLFQWGCDESIIPVLNLGKWPLKNKPREWEGIAIEIKKEYGLPQIIPATNDFLEVLPPNEKELIRDEYFPPIELKWLKIPNLKIILVEYEHSNGTYPKELIIINKITNIVTILKRKSPFDGRC